MQKKSLGKINCTFLYLLLTCIFQPFQNITAQQGTKLPNLKGSITSNGKIIWTKSPFDYQVFIENKGQYDGKINSDDKILFAAHIGNIIAYFTDKGVVYRYDELVNKDGIANTKDGDDPDKDESRMDVPYFLSAIWENSNRAVSINTDEKLDSYYTFPAIRNGTIKTYGYKKITYKNIYPNIDVEYTFIKGKEGIKYTLIVHPGAKISTARLKYYGAKSINIDTDGNIDIRTSWGKLTDHSPISYYGEDQNHVASSYQLNNNVESFIVTKIDTTKTLMIDPWTTLWTQTPFTNNGAGSVNAYDLDYDYNGNVYVYGGVIPYELVKLNSAGTILWTYTTSNFSPGVYGAFAVDKVSGSCFACEGITFTVPQTDKINNAGFQTATFTASDSSNEDWRMRYDLNNHQVIIAGGGTSNTYQATLLDTNLVNHIYVNVLNFPSNTAQYNFHDMVGIAIDPTGTACYMATAFARTTPLIDSNHLIKMPLPTLTPTSYNVSDNYNFKEVASILYVTGSSPGSSITNGMNCMAASLQYLYMYDGITLRQFMSATGIHTLSATLAGASPFNWGGIDVDLCDNIYVGNQTNVEIYNSSLTNTGTIGPFPGNIYDVKLGYSALSSLDTTLYVCGDGFVSRISLSPNINTKIDKTVIYACGCNNTATATLTFCGNIFNITNLSYNWSNGQSTQTATGLCPGTYTITIKLGNIQQFQDTVIINPISPLSIILTKNPVVCISSGVAAVAVSGGSAPYTFSWSNGATTSNISGLSTGSYCVNVTDNIGCSNSACIDVYVNPPPIPNFSSDIVSGCSPLCIKFHNLSTLSSGSITNFNWSFGNGDTSHSQSPIYCYPAPGVYTVQITAISDSGCSATLIKNSYITVYSNPDAGFTASPQPTTILQPTIQFTDKSTDVYGIAEWNWSFGDASDSNSRVQNPSHTYQDTGTYCPRLAIMNIHGCVDTVTNCLVIDPLFTLYIPSAFSPNGDGLNEIFTPKGNDIKSFEMYVFDRWGMELFYSNDINNGWNGTFKNGICLEDTYVYVITVYDSKNMKRSYTGTVNLLK